MNNSITTNELTREFGDIRAVDGLTVDLPRQSVIGFVGPNGSGKSTTIRMLLGLISPTRGSARVLGASVDTPSLFCDDVGALVENPAFIPSISARANLDSMALLRSIPLSRVADVLATVGLTEHAHRKVSQYSLGMKQRLGIALALLPDPQLLILDEPTNGLDPAGIVEIRALLRQFADEGRTVVVSSHLLSEIEAAADHLIVIRSGTLVYAGPLSGLLDQERRFVEIAPTSPEDLPRLEEHLHAAGWEFTPDNGGLRVVADPSQSGEINATSMDAGVVLARVVPIRETLEDVFLRLTGGGE